MKAVPINVGSLLSSVGAGGSLPELSQPPLGMCTTRLYFPGSLAVRRGHVTRETQQKGVSPQEETCSSGRVSAPSSSSRLECRCDSSHFGPWGSLLRVADQG